MFKAFRNVLRGPVKYRIELGDQGFYIKDSNDVERFIRYDHISSVTAYKRDFLTEDMICFSMSYLDGSMERAIEVNEDMSGFGSLISKLSESLDGFDVEWRCKVVKPAFHESKAQIYKRAE